MAKIFMVNSIDSTSLFPRNLENWTVEELGDKLGPKIGRGFLKNGEVFFFGKHEQSIGSVNQAASGYIRSEDSDYDDDYVVKGPVIIMASEDSPI